MDFVLDPEQGWQSDNSVSSILCYPPTSPVSSDSIFWLETRVWGPNQCWCQDWSYHCGDQASLVQQHGHLSSLWHHHLSQKHDCPVHPHLPLRSAGWSQDQALSRHTLRVSDQGNVDWDCDQWQNHHSDIHGNCSTHCRIIAQNEVLVIQRTLSSVLVVTLSNAF